MNRVVDCLAKLKSQGKKALVTYIVNGDPNKGVTLNAMHALVEAGVDIIELGVPFSDPMAEGVVIQKGHERALAVGASLRSSIDVVSEFRKTNSYTPVILMGYANPIEKMGYEAFASLAGEAGVDGALTVDLPPEESATFNQIIGERDLVSISLIAPTTTSARIKTIADQSNGFLYYVSLKGVTGAGHLDPESVQAAVDEIRSLSSLPVLVGFGIKDAESARIVGACADGVIVGSLLVNIMGENSASTASEIADKLQQAISPIREALDAIAV